jgi:hypothetical protein
MADAIDIYKALLAVSFLANVIMLLSLYIRS